MIELFTRRNLKTNESEDQRDEDSVDSLYLNEVSAERVLIGLVARWAGSLDEDSLVWDESD